MLAQPGAALPLAAARFLHPRNEGCVRISVMNIRVDQHAGNTHHSSARRLSALDRAISRLDQAVRVAAGDASDASRPYPAGTPGAAGNSALLSDAEQRHAAGLMRVNHTGEVCAQALYAGQAATAQEDTVRQAMEQAADEELDHLAWCQARLDELNSRPSLLNPVWYAGSYAIGAVAGLAGDRWSLGFLKETENQVEAHLADHLERLPPQDTRSRQVLEQMKFDEAEHARMAEQAGAADLPGPLRQLMRITSGLMKAVAYRL